MNKLAHALTIGATVFLIGCNRPPPGKPELPKHTPPPKPIELDRSTKTGQELYTIYCLSCHGEQGAGTPEIFPPLTGSARLTSPKNFVHGLIHGFPLPPDVVRSRWIGEMPKFGYLSDAELAEVSNYVLQEWGNAPGEVTVEIVAEQRDNP